MHFSCTLQHKERQKKLKIEEKTQLITVKLSLTLDNVFDKLWGDRRHFVPSLINYGQGFIPSILGCIDASAYYMKYITSKTIIAKVDRRVL